MLIISHITFRDCHVHIFSDNHSRNCCIWYFQHVVALTREGGRHAPPWNLSNLGAQTSHFLSFPQDIFIKKIRRKCHTVFPRIISGGDYFFFRIKRGWLFEGRRFFQLLLKLGSWINFQSLNHHSSVLLDQIPLHLYKVGIKERKDDERGGGRLLFEGGDYFKYFHQRGAIIRGRRLIEGRLFFKEIRWLVL